MSSACGAAGCLLAVHCHSRYAFVRWDVPPLQREDIPASSAQAWPTASPPPASPRPGWRAIWKRPGPACLTRTHGRREVAFLNRAWEDVLALDLCLDTERQAQPLLDRAVNTCSSRCAGFEGLGTGLERISASLL